MPQGSMSPAAAGKGAPAAAGGGGGGGASPHHAPQPSWLHQPQVRFGSLVDDIDPVLPPEVKGKAGRHLNSFFLCSDLCLFVWLGGVGGGGK